MSIVNNGVLINDHSYNFCQNREVPFLIILFFKDLKMIFPHESSSPTCLLTRREIYYLMKDDMNGEVYEKIVSFDLRLNFCFGETTINVRLTG